MQKPSLSLLISNSSNNIEFKIHVLKPKMKLCVLETLLINIYKHLYSNVFKRVINVYKRVPTFEVTFNQMFVKFNGVATIGELRI